MNVSSSGAKIAIPLIGAYSASKFGLEGMSDALRRELMLFGAQLRHVEGGAILVVRTSLGVHQLCELF